MSFGRRAMGRCCSGLAGQVFRCWPRLLKTIVLERKAWIAKMMYNECFGVANRSLAGPGVLIQLVTLHGHTSAYVMNLDMPVRQLNKM